jgi:flagellar export protein FliJ
MAFVFPFQTLLRLREINEETELQNLRALATQLSAARAELAALETLAAEQRRELCRVALQGLSAAELHFGARREFAQRQRRSALLGKLAELEKFWQAQQAVYLEARREREILSTLRAAQRAAYVRELERREQRALDALFLLRFGPGREDSAEDPPKVSRGL